MGKPSAPAPPDYAAAAQATAAGDLANARSATQANRPDIYTPTYSQTWQQDPNNPDQWTGTQTLTPEQQAIFGANQNLQLGLGQLGNQAVGSVGSLFDTRYTTPGGVPTYQGPAGQLPSYGENRQQVMDAMLARVTRQNAQDRETKSAQLIAQGIPKGSEAYNREMTQLDQQLTDARQQAEIAATQQATQEYGANIAGRQQQGQEGMAQFSTGLQGLQQQIQNALLERQTPLNEISAFRSGTQVNMPQFQSYGQQPFTGGPDLLGAAQSQYNAQMGNYNAQQAGSNNLMSGLFSLGSAFAGSPTGASTIAGWF